MKAWEIAIEKWEEAIKIRKLIKTNNADPAKKPLPFSKNAQTTPPRPPTPELPEETEPPSQPRIKEDDMPNFLKLSAALSILLARTITLEQLDVGYDFLIDYLFGFREVNPSPHPSTIY